MTSSKGSKQPSRSKAFKLNGEDDPLILQADGSFSMPNEFNEWGTFEMSSSISMSMETGL